LTFASRELTFASRANLLEDNADEISSFGSDSIARDDTSICG